MLKTIYPDSYANSSAQANVSSITFAGTVVGMLFFGYTSDHFSRKWSLFTSTIIIILFAILGTASYGAGGSPSGLLTALVVYRFFLGIGVCFRRDAFNKFTDLQQVSVESIQQAVSAAQNPQANSSKEPETSGLFCLPMFRLT
jgi:MFS family permease